MLHTEEFLKAKHLFVMYRALSTIISPRLSWGQRQVPRAQLPGLLQTGRWTCRRDTGAEAQGGETGWETREVILGELHLGGESKQPWTMQSAFPDGAACEGPMGSPMGQDFAHGKSELSRACKAPNMGTSRRLSRKVRESALAWSWTHWPREDSSVLTSVKGASHTLT